MLYLLSHLCGQLKATLMYRMGLKGREDRPKEFLASKEIMTDKTNYLSEEFAMKMHVLYEALFQQTNLEIRTDLSG